MRYCAHIISKLVNLLLFSADDFRNVIPPVDEELTGCVLISRHDVLNFFLTKEIYDFNLTTLE